MKYPKIAAVGMKHPASVSLNWRVPPRAGLEQYEISLITFYFKHSSSKLNLTFNMC